MMKARFRPSIPSHVRFKGYNHEIANHKTCKDKVKDKLEVLKCLDHKHVNGMMPMCACNEIA